VKGLKWRLIGNKLAEKHDIKVEDADVLESAKANMRQMFGGGQGVDDALVTQYATQMLEQEEFFNRSYASAFNDKILNALKDEVSTEKKVVDKEEIEQIMESFRKADEAKAVPEATAEEE
jgi:trigger factor